MGTNMSMDMHNANFPKHTWALNENAYIPSKSTKWHTSPPQHFVSLTFSAVSFASLLWELCALLTVFLYGSVYIYTLTHSLYTCTLSVSVWPRLSVSLPLSPSPPLFAFPSHSLLFFTCLSTAAVVQFATWPVNNFPETPVDSLSNPRSNLTHWEIQVHIFQQGRGGAKWGGATTTGLFFSPHKHTYKGLHMHRALSQ